IQGVVLRNLKNAIANSMGPAGSNTLILRGNSSQDLVAMYSKDGNKIIKNILYQNPIEMSIKTEIAEITRQVERVVGDGTTSAVILSSLIFDALNEKYKNGEMANPYKVIRDFKAAVKNISDKIRERGRECTLEDIYNLSLITTNGNVELSEEMKMIYETHGMDVYIDVSASTDGNSYIKDYDGITLESGYSDAAYINTIEGVSRVMGTKAFPEVRTYYFADPIDTPEQGALFQSIIKHNVFERHGNPEGFIPTVIVAPLIGRDMQGFMRQLVQYLYQYTQDKYSQKPQLLVITNIAGLDRNHIDNIMTLCGCPVIQKYIDDKQQKVDQDNGLAPRLDNVFEFYGSCSMVEADANKTRFIDPAKMYKKDPDTGEKLYDEKGAPIPCDEYTSILEFLNAELRRAQSTGEHAGVIGGLKRQIHTFNANMVEYFVGGISISDRDSLRDLVEDAVLNCRSASAYGIGYAAGFEGLRATIDLLENAKDGLKDYYTIIYKAYYEYMKMLYDTVVGEEEADRYVIKTVENDMPVNLSTMEFDGKVLTSIESDPIILDAISKIITIMLTANQALVQAPNINMY
ncbi:MAG: hypothetical protein IKA36_05595, partial [Clostridia bacterium]|nr:hypothetical protein [Clostridia bacterium]